MGNYFWNLALFLFEQKVVKIKKAVHSFCLTFLRCLNTRHNTWHNSRIIWSVLQFSNSMSWFPQLTDITSFENIKINIIFFFISESCCQSKEWLWLQNWTMFILSSWHDLITHEVLFAFCIHILFITPLVDLPEKVLFYHKPTPVTCFRQFKNQTTEFRIKLKATVNSQNLLWYKFHHLSLLSTRRMGLI